MNPSRGLVRLVPQLHPPVLEHAGPGVGALQVNADVDPAQQLTSADAARPAHAAGKDGNAECYGLPGEAADGGAVEVETGRRGARVG